MSSLHQVPSPRRRKEAGRAGPLRARLSAWHCLKRVLQQQQPLEQALAPMQEPQQDKKQERPGALGPRERRFCEYLVRVVLKQRVWLTRLSAACLHKPFDALPEPVQWLMLLGTAQCHFMEVPPYAAVETTVALARELGYGRYSGMINASLKAVAALDPAAYRPAASAAVPAWLADALRADYGEQRAEAVLEASLSDRAHIDITARDSAPEAVRAMAAALDGVWMGGPTIRMAAGQVLERLPGYEAGAWWVQDRAAALPLYALREVIAGRQVLDIGAAPGGKTMQLCAYGAAEVTALDRSRSRLARLRANLRRTGFQASCVQADLLHDTAHTALASAYEVVVLDAPCSATGTLRRHPDMLWQRSGTDVARVVDLQARMLERALGLVKPGGRLVYITCSLLMDEGERQIAALQAKYPGLRLCSLGEAQALLEASPEQTLAGVGPEGYYRALPDMGAEAGGLDGFFAACLQRDDNEAGEGAHGRR